jgi:hypothetical protein
MSVSSEGVMSLQDEPHITVKATLVRQTAAAWLLMHLETEEEFWIPKSQGEWVASDTWAITKWIADQKGIV